jgi:predicted ferric reductase
MGNLLYIIAVILIIGWLLGNFAFNVGGIIHVLLVIAVILFLVKLLGGRSSV